MMLLLLACADPEPTPDLKTDLNTEDATAPDPESSVDPPTPALSFEEVAEEIELALARGIPNPIEARAAYVQAIETGGDNQCPGSGYTVITAFEGCTSQLGWLYAGYSEYSGPHNLSQRRDFHLLADVRFRDPQEQWYYSGGELAFQPDGDYAWWCGNQYDPVHANCRANSCVSGSAKPVGLKLPNGYGLYDMPGNIREFTTDWYGCTFPNSTVDPYCSTIGGAWPSANHRIVKSGCWACGRGELHASSRFYKTVSYRSSGISFRLVRHD